MPDKPRTLTQIENNSSVPATVDLTNPKALMGKRLTYLWPEQAARRFGLNKPPGASRSAESVIKAETDLPFRSTLPDSLLD